MSMARNMRRLEERIAKKAAARAGKPMPDLNGGFDAGRGADQLWFEQHPHARWRLREALPGEAEAVERHQMAVFTQNTGAIFLSEFDARTATHILVEQLQPGLCTRIACLPPPAGPERDAWVQEVLADRRYDACGQYLALSPEARATASTWARLPEDAEVVSAMLFDVLLAQGKEAWP